MASPHPQSIGTCALGKPLGRGGMAEVLLGMQGPLERKVAVKAMLPEFVDDEECVERLKREAMALATLQHENIVAVHDLVKSQDLYYLVMEYVPGVNLAEVLTKGPIPLDICLLVASGLASALEHAHFRKVIHRDLKPPNIMLSYSGQVKLTDFGIAKDQTRRDITREGYMVGTPSYLSPEQIIGKTKIDGRSDIYGLGVTLFEALTGRKPFVAETETDLFTAIIRGRRWKLTDCAPHLPKVIEMMLDRCMAVDPDQRYQRAADLHRDIDRLLATVLKGTASARMVAYLRDCGHVDNASLLDIDIRELDLSGFEDDATSSLADAYPLGAGKKGSKKIPTAVIVTALVTFVASAGLFALSFYLFSDWFLAMALSFSDL